MFIKQVPNAKFWFVAKQGKAQKAVIEQFGRNLRRLRLQKGLTQEDLANDAEIPINQVGRIERGDINTTIGTAALLASVLKVRLQELFEG